MPKRFADGHKIAAHHHPRDQLIFAVSGVMRIETAEDTWVVPPDRALLMPAGIDHSIEVHGDLEMRTLYITPSAPAKIKVLTVGHLLRELISALACAPMDYTGNRRAEQIAELIATELAEAEALPLNTPLPRDPRLQQVCQRLLNDPSLNHSLDQLAHQSAASAKTLARLCVKELGMSFSVWRRRVRFSKALEMLERNRSMKEVALGCGYESPSAFSFAFRREFGTAPSEFRNVQPLGRDHMAGTRKRP